MLSLLIFFSANEFASVLGRVKNVGGIPFGPALFKECVHEDVESAEHWPEELAGHQCTLDFHSFTLTSIIYPSSWSTLYPAESSTYCSLRGDKKCRMSSYLSQVTQGLDRYVNQQCSAEFVLRREGMHCRQKQMPKIAGN